MNGYPLITTLLIGQGVIGLFTLSAYFITPSGFAQDTVAVSPLDINKDGKVDATETAVATDAKPSISDTVKDAAEVYDVAKSKDSLPKGTFWALLLGTIFKLLLSGLKLAGKNVGWFTSKDGKRVLKYSTLGLGAAAAVAANFALGWGWVDAVQLLLAGPLAVAIHEYTKDSKDPVPNV